jgi:Xaa-Pro aminopeptidase
VIESESYKRFYMHRTGHWLGKDVHDAGEYKKASIGPRCCRHGADHRAGLLHPSRRRCAAAFWNIGVRIEDDALVTADGCEIITAAAPKIIADIEALMRDGRDG